MMKRIPLRVYFLALVTAIVLALAILLSVRIAVNHSFVRNYNKGQYNTQSEEKLLSMNFPESYVPYYNLGNAAYRNGDYNSAISYYSDALKHFPPEKKECDIRVNLALSLCNTIDFYSLDTQDKIDTALFVLYKARDILLEKGCATNEGDGHDADAQKLKEDIDKMIELLQNPDQSQQPQDQENNDPGDDNSDSSGSGSQPSDKEKKIQGELEDNKKNALEDRKEQQDNMEKWGGSFDGDGGEGASEGDGDGGSGQNSNPW